MCLDATGGGRDWSMKSAEDTITRSAKKLMTMPPPTVDPELEELHAHPNDKTRSSRT